MLRHVRWIPVVLIMAALLVTACQPVAPGAAPAAGGEAAAAEPIVLTFSSVSVPDDAHTKGMEVFAEEVEKLTNGEITVEVYPGGQLFTQDAEQAAVRNGNVDMAYAGPTGSPSSCPTCPCLPRPICSQATNT